MTFTHLPEEQEMRMVFTKTMIDLAEQDERVVYLDADIINSIKMNEFQKRFPERTIDCGIQEANMVGVAAGISETGMIPFVHSFAPFVTRRVLDQLYLSVAYSGLNVRIIGSDPGVTAAQNGGTHIPFEDLGIMRGLQHTIVLEPTDSVMLEDLLRQSKDIYGLTYIRLSRKKAILVYPKGSHFTIGKANLLKEGNDIAIIANGVCVDDALQAAEKLEEMGIHASVCDMFTLKPIDDEMIVSLAKKTGKILTVENHLVNNGLGSAVCEVLCEQYPCKVKRLGAQDRFGEVGTMPYLKKVIGISVEDIVNNAVTMVKGE